MSVKNVEQDNMSFEKNTTLGRRRTERETTELATSGFSTAKVGERVKSKYSAFNGVIERVTEDAYIIASWYNPDTDIKVAHQRVPFGEVVSK